MSLRVVPTPLLPQLSSPEDISNFDSTNTDAGWANMDKRQRYESNGFFSDF